jgi:hypothetical protein
MKLISRGEILGFTKNFTILYTSVEPSWWSMVRRQVRDVIAERIERIVSLSVLRQAIKNQYGDSQF